MDWRVENLELGILGSVLIFGGNLFYLDFCVKYFMNWNSVETYHIGRIVGLEGFEVFFLLDNQFS